MSLRYKIFGTPKNLGDFLSETKFKNKTEVSIKFEHIGEDVNMFFDYAGNSYYLKINSGKEYLILKKYFLDSDKYNPVKTHDKIIKEFSEEAVNIAKKVREIGLNVKINGHDIETYQSLCR